MEYFNQIKVLPITQRIGTFYLAKLTPRILHRIANKKLSRYSDKEGGIQRNLNSQKVEEITKYIETPAATLPNTIIIAIQNDPQESDPLYILDEAKSEIAIANLEGVANILDGQHRLSGFSDSEEDFELPVAIFLDLSLGEQANIFAKINSTQTKVSLDLVYELFDLSNRRHTEKTAYYIVKHLSEDEISPWAGLVKRLGGRTGILAQGSMAKFFDRNFLSEGKIFHELYLSEQDNTIYSIILNYFIAVRNVFSDEWGNGELVLNKTTGFIGFSKFLIDLVKLARENKSKMDVSYFETYLRKARELFVPGSTTEFKNINFPSGAIGQRDILNILRTVLRQE